ncbi:hypothetical protein [Streptomyces geranii]|uniref:hypothetical protein n=1 Tax=Streptomyces geranii TaxID=2058923 RepID=UPI000D041980|nr:hypothetical protein [Streptomyces geranii]
MATPPSDEDFLRAVERYFSAKGDSSVRLLVPGTAELSRQPLLDFRIVRRFEVRRGGVPQRLPGKKLKQVSKRPSCTDLATEQVPVPEGFGSSPRVELVMAGSIAEVPCADCEGGKQGCGDCGGRGTQDCVRKVDCAGCGGGDAACLSCGGSRTAFGPRNRQPSRTTSGPRVQCARCGSHNAACPGCAGRQIVDCPACAGTGLRQCESCKGATNFRHEECKGTGFFTTWTEAHITHPVVPDREQERARAYLWWPTYRQGGWRETPLTDITAKLPPDLPDDHRARVEPHLAHKQGEVRRRATLRHLPVARITVNDRPNWVYFAFPGRAGTETTGVVEVVRRPSRPRVVLGAGIATAVLVTAVLVALLATR